MGSASQRLRRPQGKQTAACAKTPITSTCKRFRSEIPRQARDDSEGRVDSHHQHLHKHRCSQFPRLARDDSKGRGDSHHRHAQTLSFRDPSTGSGRQRGMGRLPSPARANAFVQRSLDWLGMTSRNGATPITGTRANAFVQRSPDRLGTTRGRRAYTPAQKGHPRTMPSENARESPIFKYAITARSWCCRRRCPR